LGRALFKLIDARLGPEVGSLSERLTGRSCEGEDGEEEQTAW